MNDKNLNFLQTVKKYSNPRIGIVCILLIVVQFGLLPLISSELRSGSDYNLYADYSYFYVMSSYTLIVLGIVIFQAHGLELFSDHISLWVIVLSCFFRVSLGGDHALIYRIYLAFLGAVLSVYIITNRKTIKSPTLKSVFIGLLWSVSTVALIALIQALLDSGFSKSLPPNLSTIITDMFIFQISFVSVIEEACFRGLIVGFMLMNGYKENTAFSFQAILFWIGHYMAISNPVLFFVAIPLLTLSTTLIMKKYKMIFLPIMTHTLVNVFTSIVVIVLQQSFA